MEKTPVIILCGGKGTRIRDVSEILPKPMLPIGQRPVLWHIMKLYAYYGCRDFILCLGYKGNVIKEFFLNYRAYTEDLEVHLKGGNRAPEILYYEPCSEDGWRVILAETGDETQTGGRVHRGFKYVKEQTFMLTYGDGVGDVDIPRLLEFHRSHGKLVTVTGVRPPGRFGEIGIDGTRVYEFNEKPQITSGLINGGFFVIEREFIDRYSNDDAMLILEAEPLRTCAKDGQMQVYTHDGFWQPMDTLREYNLLNEMWNSGEASWKVWDDPVK